MTTTSLSPLSAAQFDDLHDFIGVQVAAGYAGAADIVDDAVDLYTTGPTDAVALRAAAWAIVDQALAWHRASQAEWPQTTDCDRLDAAFADLDRTGIVARQHFSCCGTCGAHDILDEMQQAEKTGRSVRGYTFFHAQDTDHAVAGEPLYLSYGVAHHDPDDAVAVGHEIVATLRQHDLSPAWNGKHAHRIALPLEWRRRRS